MKNKNCGRDLRLTREYYVTTQAENQTFHPGSRIPYTR